MSATKDPIEIAVVEPEPDGFGALSRRAVSNDGLSTIVWSGAVTASLHSVDPENQPLICDLPGLPGEIIPARTTVSLTSGQAGSTLVVLFEQGDIRRPIIVGVVRQPGSAADRATDSAKNAMMETDDGRVVISADREIVLHCGEASITLTRAGKLLIRGAYVSSHSSGVHRVKGATVEIN